MHAHVRQPASQSVSQPASQSVSQCLPPTIHPSIHPSTHHSFVFRLGVLAHAVRAYLPGTAACTPRPAARPPPPGGPAARGWRPACGGGRAPPAPPPAARACIAWRVCVCVRVTVVGMLVRRSKGPKKERDAPQLVEGGEHQVGELREGRVGEDGRRRGQGVLLPLIRRLLRLGGLLRLLHRRSLGQGVA